MQKGILIQTGGHTLWKSVYAGNPVFAETEFTRLTAKYPGLIVTLYTDTDPAFANAQVDMPGMIEER